MVAVLTGETPAAPELAQRRHGQLYKTDRPPAEQTHRQESTGGYRRHIGNSLCGKYCYARASQSHSYQNLRHTWHI